MIDKYPIGQQTVDAAYDKAGSQNPLIEALPTSLGVDGFVREIRSLPPPPVHVYNMTLTERKQALHMIPSLFVPMAYMYYIYDSLFRMLQSSYHTLNSRDSVKRVNALFATNGASASYSTQAQSGALLGTPGLGKTTTLKRCLMLTPQVIAHEKYLGKPFFTKQVLWLFVECPSDASQKTMAYNIVRALDLAVGSNHLDYLTRTKSTAASAVATYIKVLCMTYHVGLLIIDEIQNVVATAQRTNRVKPLIRFLTELTNDTCTSVYFSGTMLAESVFQTEEYLRRRTRGPRLLPLKPDNIYRDFLQQLWHYQFTPERAQLTDKLANQIYDYSGGIPAYISKLFEEAQAQTLMRAADRIDGKLIAAAADYLAILPPKELGKGTFISDFTLPEREAETGVTPPGAAVEHPSTQEVLSEPLTAPAESSEGKRLYANQRGRKNTERDKRDMIVAYKAGTLRELLLSCDMVEEVVLC